MTSNATGPGPRLHPSLITLSRRGLTSLCFVQLEESLTREAQSQTPRTHVSQSSWPELPSLAEKKTLPLTLVRFAVPPYESFLGRAEAMLAEGYGLAPELDGLDPPGR